MTSKSEPQVPSTPVSVTKSAANDTTIEQKLQIKMKAYLKTEEAQRELLKLSKENNMSITTLETAATLLPLMILEASKQKTREIELGCQHDVFDHSRPNTMKRITPIVYDWDADKKRWTVQCLKCSVTFECAGQMGT